MQFGVLVRPGDGVWSNLAYAVEEPRWNTFYVLGCGCDLDEVERLQVESCGVLSLQNRS